MPKARTLKIRRSITQSRIAQSRSLKAGSLKADHSKPDRSKPIAQSRIARKPKAESRMPPRKAQRQHPQNSNKSIDHRQSAAPNAQDGAGTNPVIGAADAVAAVFK